MTSFLSFLGVTPRQIPDLVTSFLSFLGVRGGTQGANGGGGERGVHENQGGKEASRRMEKNAPEVSGVGV